MAIIVGYEGEHPLIRSQNNIGISREEEENAAKLDSMIHSRIARFANAAQSKKSVGKGLKDKVELYWNYGHILADIFENSGLVVPAEKELFFMNVKMNTPEGILAEDRSPNRNHIAYCFRLAQYPKPVALKMKWSEWVYLFDQSFIKKEPRFDAWHREKLKAEPHYATRKMIRCFSQVMNAILNKIETADLKETELYSCYESAWIISKSVTSLEDNSEEDLLSKIKDCILKDRNLVGKLLDGAVTPDNYADTISKECRITKV